MSALTSLLVRDEVVSVRQIEDAIARQVLEGGELDTALLELQAAPENVLNAYCAASLRLPAVARDEVMGVNAATLSLISQALAERLRIIPITHDATTLLVARTQPLSDGARAEIEAAIGMRVEFCICCELRIAAALELHYGVRCDARIAQLASRIEQEDAGTLPVVEPMQETPISGLAEELFSDIDDADEPDAGAMPIEPESLTPAPAPVQEVSVARVIEVPPSERPAAASRPHATQRGMPASSAPPPPEALQSLGPRSRSAVTADNLTAAPSGKAANDVVFTKPARPPKRGPAVPQGPLTRELASQLLERADDRDMVVEVFFRYARQYFEATALCSVREDRVLGREVHNVPNLIDIRHLTLSVQRGSGLEEVLRTAQPRVDDMSRRAEDQPLVEALRRMACQPSALLPICVQRRVVAVIYGDRGGDYFQRSDLGQLVELLPEVSRAFERIIRTRKVLGLSARAQSVANAKLELGHAATQPDISQTPRALAPDPAKAEALLRNARRALSALGVPRSAPPPPAAAPRVAAGQVQSRPQARDAAQTAVGVEFGSQSAQVAGLAQAVAGTASAAAVAGVATLPKATPGSSAQYAAIGGAFEGAVLAAAQNVREGRPILPPPEPEAPAEDSQPEAAQQADDPRQDAHEAISGALGALEQLERLPTARLPAVEAEEAEPEPPPRPPAYLSKPPPGAGRYSSLREGEGDDFEPDTKRVRQQRTSNRPRRSARPEPVSATADTQTTLPRIDSPLPEEARTPSPRPSKPPPGTGLYRSRTVSSEVISLSAPVPVGGRRASSPPRESRRSQRPPAATASAAAPVETQQPEASVIVDTLGQTRALVDDLCKCGPDDEGPIVQSLLRVGSQAIDVLIERFPGPLWFDRRRPYARLPFGRDTGPIARALAAFGTAALAKIHPLLRAQNPDVRYYATLFLSDQVHPDLLVPIAERLFDDDPQIRLMVRDTLPAYRQLPAFAQVLGSLRTRMLDARAVVQARLAAIDALTHLRDGQSVLPLVELLAHPDRQLSVPAHRALVTITCQDFGSSTKKWRGWFEENQSRHRVQWLIDSLMHSEQNLRSAAGIELQKVTQVYYGYVASAPKRDRERAQRRYQDWWESEGHKRF